MTQSQHHGTNQHRTGQKEDAAHGRGACFGHMGSRTVHADPLGDAVGLQPPDQGCAGRHESDENERRQQSRAAHEVAS